ncbi:MAG: leucine-rich repeat protein, partial [Clostridia bacterium]|nr:leucine-rich repeat protein [Clostridia bacterium]
VVLNEGLTYIHDYAFSSTGITSVTIPKTVSELREGVFAYNENLTTVTFEGALPTNMGAWLFCEEERELPTNFKIFANSAMLGWSELQATDGNAVLSLDNNHAYPVVFTANEIPDGIIASSDLGNMTWRVTTDGVLEIALKEGAEDTWMPDFEWAGETRAPWYGYSQYITSINVGDGISNIGDRAFLDQYNAVSVKLPDSLERIGDAAFWCCESLTSITIPASVYEICDNAFVANKSMTEYVVEADNEHYQVVAGALCRDEGRFLMFYPVGNTVEYYDVPAGVVEINGCAYEYNHFTYVTIPAGVEHIYNDAFALSDTLEQVIISTTVCDIGDRVFADCPKLTYAIFEGAAPIYAGWDVFGYMDQYNPDFRIQCYRNAGWVVTNGMWNSIEDQYYPIEYCDGEAANIEDGTITHNENMFDWHITPDGTLVITGSGELPDFVPEEEGGVGPAPWYDYRASVRQIVVEDGITLIGYETFTDMSGLTEAQLPETLTTIKDNGFRSTSLPMLNIPASLTDIYSGAFGSMYNLAEIKVEEGNTAFMVGEDGVLYSADGTRLFLYPAAREAEVFEVPDGVVSIEAQAFQNARVPEIILPGTLETIGWAAFCHGALETITIPASVKHIEGDAFNWAWELRNVYFNGVVLRIDHNIFESIADNVIIHYPAGSAIWENQLLKNEDGSIWKDNDGYAHWQPNENNPEYRALGDVDVELIGNLAEGTYENTDGEECTWYIDLNGVLHFTGSGSMPDWEDFPEWYDYCEIVTGVEFGKELTNIGKLTLRDFNGIETITIPGNIKRIREEAITECNGLTALVLEEGIEVIESGAINCPRAEFAVSIPASVTELAWRPFGETLVTGYSVAEGNAMYSADDDGVIYYSDAEDENFIGLHSYPIGNSREEYAIKEGVNDIAPQAFCGSTLKTITMPDTVRYIAWWAFSWCENLTEITLSADLILMDNNVFTNSSQLSAVYFRSNPPENESFLDLFLGCADNLMVYYPAGSEAWQEFANCDENGAGEWVMDHEIFDETIGEWTTEKISVPVDDYTIEGNLAEGTHTTTDGKEYD